MWSQFQYWRGLGSPRYHQEAADREQGWGKDEDEEKKYRHCRQGCIAGDFKAAATALQSSRALTVWLVAVVEGRAVPLPWISAPSNHHASQHLTEGLGSLLHFKNEQANSGLTYKTKKVMSFFWSYKNTGLHSHKLMCHWKAVRYLCDGVSRHLR